MKNNHKYVLFVLVLCLMCSLAFAACNKDIDTPPTPPEPPIEESKVTLSDSALKLDVNDTATLTVRQGGSVNQQWTSKNTAVATVDANGTVTAVSEGTTEVEVTTANGKASCTVLVVNSYIAPLLTVDTDQIVLANGDNYLLLPKLTYKGVDCTSKASFTCTLVDGELDGIVTVACDANGISFSAKSLGNTKYVVYVKYVGVELSAVVDISVIDMGIVFDVTNLTPTSGGYGVVLSTYEIDGYFSAVTPQVNVTENGQTTNNVAVVYTTDNASVASITSDGQIVAVDEGKTKVHGTYKTNSFAIDVTVAKPTLDVVATNKVVEVGRLQPLEFDRPLAGELTSAKIGDCQVGDANIDGKLALDRNKLETMPVADYGENVQLLIETTKVKYRTEIDLYTLVIKNKQDYMSMGALSKAACKDNDKLFGGYFVFGDNVTVNGGMSEFIDRTKTDFNGDGSQGFCGVIDGKGYVISGLTKTTDNGNAFISVMHRDGVLKNLGLINASFQTNSGSFLIHTGRGTVENVYVKYDTISGASPDGYSGTIYNANLTLNKMIVDASCAQISGNGSKFLLMTDNRYADLNNFICILGDSYTKQDVVDGKVTVEGNQDFSNEEYEAAFGKKVFFGFKALKESPVFVNLIDWNNNYWHINEENGEVNFGVKTYVEPQMKYKTIDVSESDRLRVETDINNDGTLNTSKVVSVDIANIIGESNYTLVSVNGVGAASNAVTADMFGYLYGNRIVEIVVDVEYTRYTINLPVLLVSKVIKTADDYKAWVVIARNSEEGGHNYGGYFELGNNISSEDGSIQMVYADKDAWDGAGGFSGTFDGCGYVIDGLVATVANDHSTFIGEMKPDAVLKNIGFTNVEMSGITFLTRTTNGTLQNIYVQYKKINVASGQTVLARENATVENMFVDASAAEITNGSSYGILGSRHAQEKSYCIYGIVPSGFNSYVDHGTNGCGHGFATYALLKADGNAWNAVEAYATACEYWQINTETGVVKFGK